MLNIHDFLRLIRAGVLTYAREYDQGPGVIFVVRGAPSAIKLTVLHMPSQLSAAPRPDWVADRWNNGRDRRIAETLVNAAEDGALNGHTELWLHARLNDLQPAA
jgi:hypothetical protein